MNSEAFIADILEHTGVKGMRWGVRKDRSSSKPLVGLGPDKVVRKLKNGDTITLVKNKPNMLIKSIAKVSKNYEQSYRNGASFTIMGKDGKKVGQANLWKKSNEELYLNWISIDKSARGQGYATATLGAAEQYGKQMGFKKMTLEVPGIAPDAKHIYKKMGFVETKTETVKDPIWGGLTTMEYRFK